MGHLRAALALVVAVTAVLLVAPLAHGGSGHDHDHHHHDHSPAGWSWDVEAGDWVFEVNTESLVLASDRVQEASAITLGRPVDVYCAASTGSWPMILTSIPQLDRRAVAFAWFDRGPVVLSKAVCKQVEKTARDRGSRWAKTRAVAILAHELGHVAGHVDEHVADCWSAGRSKRLAKAFGLERPMAVRRDVIRFLGLAGADCDQRLRDSAFLRLLNG